MWYTQLKLTQQKKDLEEKILCKVISPSPVSPCGTLFASQMSSVVVVGGESGGHSGGNGLTRIERPSVAPPSATNASLVCCCFLLLQVDDCVLDWRVIHTTILPSQTSLLLMSN